MKGYLVSLNRVRRVVPAVAAAGMMAAFGAAPALADLLSIGGKSGGGLGISANLGGVKAGVTVGGGSVASVDATGPGVGATAKVGGGSVAAVDANVGSVDVKATVGGTSTASACVGNCGASTGPGTTPANPDLPTQPGTTPVAGKPFTSPTAKPVVPKVLACAAASGNTTAFNGYPLYDRDGRMLGIIHSAQLNSEAKIQSVSIQSVKKRCTTIGRTGFTVAGYAVTGAFDAKKSGMAFAQ